MTRDGGDRPNKNLFGWLLAMPGAVLRSDWVTPGPAQAAFDRLEARENAGSRVHGALAALGAAMLVGPTSISEFAFAPVLVMFFVRAHRAWPTWVHWFGQTPWLGVMAWAAWMAASLAWSPDRAHGVTELADLRWAVVGVLIWPAIRWRRWVIAGLIVGYAAGHASQVFQGVQEAMGVEQPFWDRDRRRLSGWWDPAVSGSLLTAAVGLHAGVALMGRGRWRWVAWAMLVVTLIAVGATGTRSGWVSSTALVGLIACVAVVRALRRSSPGRALLATGVMLVAGGVVAGGAWTLAGDEIGLRARETAGEFERALAGDLDSATGHRILMNRWAAEAFIAHPIRGVGAGGYRVWADAHALEQGEDEAGAHAHAHNAVLHLAATQGAVGIALAAVIAASALGGAFRRSSFERGSWYGLGTYDASPAWALMGLMIVSAFDTIQHNAQTAAVWWLMVGISVPWKPRFGGLTTENVENTEGS